MTTPLLETVQQQLQDEPLWKLVVAACMVSYGLQSLLAMLMAPANRPPFYYELPYIPWLGSLVQFAVNPRELIQRGMVAHKDKNCFTVHLFGTPMTFLTGSEGLAHFFKAREHVFDIREAYAMTIITFGPGVCYDCPQSKMAQQFAFFKDGLSDKSFIKHMELVQEETLQYFDKHWGKSGEADILQTLSDLYTLTSSRCLLGDEIRAQWNESGMAEHYIALDHSFVPILFFFPSIPNPHRSKCVTARELFKEMFQKVIDKRRQAEANDDNYQKPHDFLQVLMEAKYRDGSELEMQEITGIMIGVLLGGQHTSNVTGSWLLSHLLREPKWLQAVMDEQRKLFPDDGEHAIHPATLTFDQVNKEMPVMDQVLSETLRLHPPFFQLSRKVLEDSNFNGITIPKGNIVNISPSASMRDPAMWDDPHTFDPTRFAPENKDKIKQYAWVPFGGGMHQCGGRKFAWNSLKVSLTWILRNYEIEIIGKGANEFPKEDYTTMVVAPTSSHTRVRFKRREQVDSI
ncbi:Obtusifoliol 14-alpha demethylase (Fragment) [Seminavis robusta]|uniref:Obtusifoliol 14-alpha demethylase n=1 Tax=Seminavis robusta TaxID=568900 RepID=A0A9N8EBC5_9STRA